MNPPDLCFRLLFDSSPAPMVIFQSGRVTHANAAAAWLLEARVPEALLGRELLSLIHPDFHQVTLERLRMVNEEGQPTPPMEKLLLTLQGNSVWVEVQSVPLDLPDGPAILVFAQDLTEQRRAAEDRLKLATELQHAQKLASLGSLAGGIAHDMNNALSAVLGMASLLQLKYEGDAPLQKSLRTIEHAADRGRELVKDLAGIASASAR
jgi:PAS domain S-box-containing protein